MQILKLHVIATIHRISLLSISFKRCTVVVGLISPETSYCIDHALPSLRVGDKISISYTC